jgi:hypothetical protein
MVPSRLDLKERLIPHPEHNTSFRMLARGRGGGSYATASREQKVSTWVVSPPQRDLPRGSRSLTASCDVDHRQMFGCAPC